VVMAGIGSNHCRWRAGKGALGLPGDDWGIFALKQIRKALAMNPDRFGHVSVLWPDKHEETLALDVAGTIIGLHSFGMSAPQKAVTRHFGFEPTHVVAAARAQVVRHAAKPARSPGDRR